MFVLPTDHLVDFYNYWMYRETDSLEAVFSRMHLARSDAKRDEAKGERRHAIRLSDIPTVHVEHICTYLDWRAITALAQTSRTLRTIVHSPFVRHLPEAAKMHHKTLTSVRYRAFPEGFWQRLRSIRTFGADFSPEIWDRISTQCTQLSELHAVASKNFTEEKFCTFLQTCQPRDGSPGVLHTLDLSHATNISGESFARIRSSFPQLHTIILLACKKLTDSGAVEILRRSPNAQVFDVSGTAIKGTRFDQLATNYNLTTAAFSWAAQLREENLCSFLHRTPHITQLFLQGTMITGTAFTRVRFGELPVTKLDLSCCKALTDEGLKNILARMPHVQSLNLTKTQITGLQFATTQLRNVTEVDFTSCDLLTFAGVQALVAQARRLRKLHLDATPITADQRRFLPFII